VFADVTGSTALGERLDVESFRQVIGRYFELARTCLERHGGTVEKFIGDAVVEVFGVPAVHEDDAVRAVRAAAELRDSLATLNAALERDYGVALELRVGVNSGEVITDPNQIATGDAMNVAARLERRRGRGRTLRARGDGTRAAHRLRRPAGPGERRPRRGSGPRGPTGGVGIGTTGGDPPVRTEGEPGGRRAAARTAPGRVAGHLRGAVVVEREVKIRTQNGQMTTFIAHPEGGGPFPIAVLYMDGVGYRDQIKRNARRFAADGYYLRRPGPVLPLRREARVRFLADAR
jgi:hypothetical protein